MKELAIEMTKKNIQKCKRNFYNAKNRDRNEEEINNIRKKIRYYNYILNILQEN